ncbi:hypothetical protein ACQHIV_42190 (plasmid) [Kribbella sp. GL6]|uniref:hypothetical protein n=1 Tax=Kribbella sp. GL6 TaxID=3419765 RepID=UPI003CFDF54A
MKAADDTRPAAPNALQGLTRVQVWLDAHLISDWTGPADVAQRLADRQRRDHAHAGTVVCEPVRPDENGRT